MKNYLTIIALSILCVTASAQEVWTEGTIWEIEYTAESNLPNVTYALEAGVELDGVAYYPLTETTAGARDTIAYIRSERGDSLVYARIFNEGTLQPETLLYDFTKAFDYGDEVRYGTQCGVVTNWISQSDSTLYYLHDILEEGDCLPVWNGIIYKLGHIEGPLHLYFNTGVDSEGPTSKPKPTNVSHILFGTKGGEKKSISISNVVNYVCVVRAKLQINAAYDLSGRQLSVVPQKGVFVVNGRVVVK